MLTKRAVLAGLAVLALTPAVLAQAFETKPMTVPEMQANGGLIVDIRTPEEWAETGVIDGARLVTFVDTQSFIAAVGAEIADGRDLILVCRSGRRSGAAAQALRMMIPNHIISVDGGMSLIIDGGYQTVQPE